VLWFIDDQEVGAFYFENKGIDGLVPEIFLQDVGSKCSILFAPANQHEEEKVPEPMFDKRIPVHISVIICNGEVAPG